MIEIDVPGYRALRLKHLVLDYNGTLACDGRLLDGVRDGLKALAARIQVHVLTADTFGCAEEELRGVACRVVVLPPDNQHTRKLEFVQRLGQERTVCVGNGRNDRLMLKQAALGMGVIGQEGASAEALLAADVVCAGIIPALKLLLNPLRLTATLRS